MIPDKGRHRGRLPHADRTGRRGWSGAVRDCVPRSAGVALVVLSTARATQAAYLCPPSPERQRPRVVFPRCQPDVSSRSPYRAFSVFAAATRSPAGIYRHRDSPAARPPSLPVSPAVRGANLFRLNVPWLRQQAAAGRAKRRGQDSHVGDVPADPRRPNQVWPAPRRPDDGPSASRCYPAVGVVTVPGPRELIGDRGCAWLRTATVKR